ncbi:MAG: hypothetical protein ACRETY_12670, partial [Steroidobacteraceae bacterium]
MPELRWILLIAGVALILGLWWWETRKTRARAGGEPADHWPQEGADAAAEAAGDAAPTAEEAAPMTYAPTVERVRIPRRPPLIEIPEDLEVDVSDFVGIERRHSAPPPFSLEPAPEVEPEVSEAANEEAANEEAAVEEVIAEEREQPDDYHRAPWVRTQPLDRDEVAPKPVEEPPEPPYTDATE